MTLLIYSGGDELYPTEKRQYEKDDYGIEYLSVVGQFVEAHWRTKNTNGKNLEKKEGMTAWHREWQEDFRNRGYKLEVPKMDNNNILRRADCLREDIKRVIEIQHSKMSYEDIMERTEAWLDLGYSIVWVFDGDTWYPNRHTYTEKRPEGCNKIRFSNTNAAMKLADRFIDDKRVSVWLQTHLDLDWAGLYNRSLSYKLHRSGKKLSPGLYRVKDYFFIEMARSYKYCVTFSREINKIDFIEGISEK